MQSVHAMVWGHPTTFSLSVSNISLPLHSSFQFTKHFHSIVLLALTPGWQELFLSPKWLFFSSSYQWLEQEHFMSLLWGPL